MKLLLLLAIAILGQVSSMSMQKSGGNCGILAGDYLGRWVEPGPEDDCGPRLCSGTIDFKVEDIDGTQSNFNGFRGETSSCLCQQFCDCLAPAKNYTGTCSDSKVGFNDYTGEISSNGTLHIINSEGHFMILNKLTNPK